MLAKLTPKQKAFVDEYLKDLNATQAAIRAGYSKKTASRIAIELLNKTHVLKYLQERQKAREHRTDITQDRVLRELAAIAFAQTPDYVAVRNGCVEIKNTDELTEDQARAISGIKEGSNGIEVKLNDKQKALELIGRHLGMWNDRLNLNVSAIDDSIKEMGEYFEQCKKAGS